MSSRLPLALAFCMVALLSMVNVNAYQQGQSSNVATVGVVSTTSALLQITSTHPQASVTGSRMAVDFSKGFAGAKFGIRPAVTGTVATEFTARSAFIVTNNSDTCQNISVFVTGTKPPNLELIQGRVSGTTYPLNSGVGLTTISTAPLTPGGTMNVDFQWRATGAAAASNTFAVRVTGQRC